MARMNRGTSGDVGKVINKSTYAELHPVLGTLKQITGHVLAAFLDWRVRDMNLLQLSGEPFFFSFQVYAFGVLYFGLFCATGSIGAFLPTIIATMGYSKFVDATMLSTDSISSGCIGTVADRPTVYSCHGCSCLHGIYF